MFTCSLEDAALSLAQTNDHRCPPPAKLSKLSVLLQVVELQANFIEENLLAQATTDCRRRSQVVSVETLHAKVSVLMPGMAFPVWVESSGMGTSWRNLINEETQGGTVVEL